MEFEWLRFNVKSLKLPGKKEFESAKKRPLRLSFLLMYTSLPNPWQGMDMMNWLNHTDI